jgi:hypothetical protein
LAPAWHNGTALLFDIINSVGKSERKRLLARPRCRWKTDNKIGLQEGEQKGVDWRVFGRVRKGYRKESNITTEILL